MAASSSKKRKVEAELKNYSTLTDEFLNLISIGSSVIKWDGMPETIDTSYYERKALLAGSVCFYYDDVYGFIGLPYSSAGTTNIYGIRSHVIAHGESGYNSPVLRVRGEWNLNLGPIRENDCIIMYDNIARLNLTPYLYNAGVRLSEMLRTCDINMNAQKTPITIVVDDGDRFNAEQQFAKYNDNLPVIITTKKFSFDNFKVLKSDAPFVAPQIYSYYKDLFTNTLNFLGVEANSSTKLERQVTDEIVSGLGYVEARRRFRLESRLQFAKLVKHFWGLELTPSFYSEYFGGWHGADNVERSIDDERNDNRIKEYSANDGGAEF